MIYVKISIINNKSNKIMVQFSKHKRTSDEKELLKLESGLNKITLISLLKHLAQHFNDMGKYEIRLFHTCQLQLNGN